MNKIVWKSKIFFFFIKIIILVNISCKLDEIELRLNILLYQVSGDTLLLKIFHSS